MKKKIGIMTMHRVINYGSFLQAFALKNILEELGHEVQFVDYKSEKSFFEPNHITFVNKVVRNINIFEYLRRKYITQKFRYKYSAEYLKLLNVDIENYNPDIDALVIGSDEVFNCLQDYPVGYSTELFGKNYENMDVISYAASFGHTTLEELKNYNLDLEIGEMLKKFKRISVRDKNSYQIIYSLTGREPFIHLDPVLISSFDKYLTNTVKLKNYIIVYAYPGRLTKNEEKFIKKFARKNGKKIVCLGLYQKIADHNLVVSPFEVLEYIKKADYVITDTFHGSIFSMKMQTKFCTIIRESNKNKLQYLLEKMKHEKQIVSSLEDIEKIYNEEIDFTNSNAIMESEKINAIDYLKKYL